MLLTVRNTQYCSLSSTILPLLLQRIARHSGVESTLTEMIEVLVYAGQTICTKDIGYLICEKGSYSLSELSSLMDYMRGFLPEEWQNGAA